MRYHHFIKATALLILCSSFTKPVTVTHNFQHSRQSIAARAGDYFDFFRTHRQGKNGITATWGFTATGIVNGFKVERTYEDPSDPYANWDIISLMPFTGERSYRYTETGVFPGYITYRVTAMYANGTEVVSSFSTVHILSH